MAIVWLLVGALVGWGYQLLLPTRQKLVISVARGAAGGLVGGFLYAVRVDPLSPASWLGAFFVATMAVCVVEAVRLFRARVNDYRRA